MLKIYFPLNRTVWFQELYRTSLLLLNKKVQFIKFYVKRTEDKMSQRGRKKTPLNQLTSSSLMN